MTLHIVLVEPEIPQNTGNISRSCVLTKSHLHLIEPLGFKIDDKSLKRAGLDYWDYLDLSIYKNFEEFVEKNKDGKFYFATTKASKLYTEIEFPDQTYIIFGKETAGLSRDILDNYPGEKIKIPMRRDLKRSLNLANSVNIIMFEALRQLDFPFYNDRRSI